MKSAQLGCQLVNPPLPLRRRYSAACALHPPEPTATPPLPPTTPLLRTRSLRCCGASITVMSCGGKVGIKQGNVWWHAAQHASTTYALSTKGGCAHRRTSAARRVVQRARAAQGLPTEPTGEPISQRCIPTCAKVPPRAAWMARGRRTDRRCSSMLSWRRVKNSYASWCSLWEIGRRTGKQRKQHQCWCPGGV